MSRPTNGRRTRYAAYSILLALLCCVPAAGQSSQTTGPTVGPAGLGKAGAGGGLDSVNLFTGKVGVNFPLIAVKGRGEAGYSASVTIDRSYKVFVFKTWSYAGDYGAASWAPSKYKMTSEGF
jgi:hypothetical protein